jgi:hypothetical protein
MKKHVLICAVLVCLLLAACQPTPEQPVVVQKDTERLVDTVVAQSPANEPGEENTNTEAEPFRIAPVSERFTYDYTGENGLVKIHADADVKTPDSGTIPMTRVKATLFSDAFAKQVFDYVYQGKQVYIQQHGPKTKAVIANELAYYQQIANNGTWAEAGMVDAQEVDEIIEQLKELYPNAPETDTTVPIPADGSLTAETYFGIEEEKLEIDDELAFLEIHRCKAHQTTSLSYTRGNLDTMIGYEESGDGSRAFVHWYSEYDSYRPNVADDTKAYGQTYSPKEAAELGLKFFRDLGIIDIAPRDICNLYVAHPSGQTKALYLIEYVRTVNGNPVAFVPLTQQQWDYEETALPWHYESIRVMVDDEGLKSVSWQNPIEVTEVISDNVKVMSFEEAANIFRSMCSTVYEPQATSFDWETHIDVNVDHVELTLLRIREQNAEGKNGLYVPAWLFYGQEVYTFGEYTEPDFSKPFTRVLFAINAVDGSIIDLSKGY